MANDPPQGFLSKRPKTQIIILKGKLFTGDHKDIGHLLKRAQIGFYSAFSMELPTSRLRAGKIRPPETPSMFVGLNWKMDQAMRSTFFVINVIRKERWC